MEEESSKDKILQVRVLGPGCTNCQRLETETFNALAELDLTADLQPVHDLKKIAEYGTLRTPALVINGKVKCTGRVPAKGEIKRLMLEELKSENQ
jgi:small redox-active disulfide protein 2